ncbi:MAG: radical SAM protein [Elusimicrobiota bacterium]
MHVKRAGDVTDPRLLALIKSNMLILPYGPRQINCCFDRSCNLSCPSCRTEVFVDNDKKPELLEIQHKIQQEGARELEELFIEGSGDPFGSPFTLEWLRSMKKANMPKLKLIRLHTNGQLLTPEMWKTIPSDIRELIKDVEISIDAATPETYHINRRGGRFETLLQNLLFLGELRKSRTLKSLAFSMVVQENNFREMPAFVSLGKQFDATCVYFSSIHNRIFSEAEFLRRAVHLPAHPGHPEFVRLLKDKVFTDPVVFLGNLTAVSGETHSD